tara:strand:+ start:20588 stop:21304 length:717 start_codon:yes stop_codon:yes gene_type:complete
LLKFKEFQWQTDIQFDEVEVIEGSPRLYVTPHGKYPSMTSLLSVFDDGSIDDWVKRVGKEEAKRISEEAINRGNALHDYNEKYLQNRLKRSELRGQAKILFNRVKRHLDKIQLVIATEVPLWSDKHKYAGRVDCICMIDDQITILDHKNTRKDININLPWNRKKLFKYMIQICGYARALHEMKGIKATQGCLIIGNHESSSSDVVKFQIESMQKELDIVINAYFNDGEGIEESLYFKM